MKNKFAKFITLIMTAVVMVSAFPSEVSAQEGYTHEFEENCKALFMFDLEDGSVVYSMNADEVLPMASLTKIMTFIVASENIPDIENTVVTVSDHISTDLAGTQSSLAGVYPGEELTVLQLLNMMMIPSGNDASLALHIYYDENIAGVTFDGTTEDTPFVELMNAKAEELGCENTHFVNPHGLHDEDHYSTARDLSKIVQYALTLPYFKEITSTIEYTIPETNKSEEERTIDATNKMLLEDYEDGMYYYEYANGIKTGSHNEAGYCIAASATKDDQTYVVIALGSPMVTEEGEYVSFHGEMIDAAELFEWGFNELSRRTLCSTTDVITEAPLQFAWKQDTLQLVPEEEISLILPNAATDEDLEIVLDTPQLIETPVTKDTVFGKATYSYEGEVLAEVNLVAAESVKRSYIVQGLSILKDIVTSVWFWLVVIVIVAVIVIHVRNEQERRRKRRRRKRRNAAGRAQRSQTGVSRSSAGAQRSQTRSQVNRSNRTKYDR